MLQFKKIQTIFLCKMFLLFQSIFNLLMLLYQVTRTFLLMHS